MQFQLPDLGEGIHEGELLKWRVQVGDLVSYDQPLCEVMTDKASIEIPSAFQGKVGQIHVPEGTLVHVGQLLLSFETTSSQKGEEAEKKETFAAPEPMAPPLPQTRDNTQPAASRVGVQTTPAPQGPVLASPFTRRLAREKGIDLTTVKGSGPHGRILREDLDTGAFITPAVSSGTSCRFSSPAAPETLREGHEARTEARIDVIPLRGLRRKIAEKMRLSKDRAAHFTYVDEADMTALVALRQKAKAWGAERGLKITYLPFFLKAMVQALKKYPTLNATFHEEKQELHCYSSYHVGISIQTDEGLMAPVIHDVERKSIATLAQELQELVEKARTKKLSREDLQGSTITLTNVGSIGGLFTTPILNYPEVAIVGLNKIFRKPVVVPSPEGEKIAIRDWTYCSISSDHRFIDGAVAATFMKELITFLEQPDLLLLE